MKKLLRNLAVLMVAAVVLFSLSAICFAESDDTVESAPDAVISSETTAVDPDAESVPDAQKSDAEDISASAVITTGETEAAEATEEAAEEAEPLVQFILLQKLAKVFDGDHATDLIMLLCALAAFVILVVVAILTGKKSSSKSFGEVKVPVIKILIMGALSLSLSFVLSYIKLFSMPFGGSITLCSMLPIMVYAAWVGPGYGFLVALCYAGLQIVQGAWIVHPVQFIFDYIIGFTAIGLSSLFRSEKLLPVGILVAGFARMICSSIAGLYYGLPEGLEMNLFAYTLLYNFMSIGIDTIICLIVYIIPPVRKMFNHLRESYLA